MSQPVTLCVFCGKPGATKGHITPKWFLKVLPNPATKHGTFQGLYRTFKPGPTVNFTPFKLGPIKQGRAGTKRPRNTCLKCNNGWMSRIEQDAQDILSPLIQGTDLILDRDAQTKLARLIGLITMRAEFTGEKPAIPASDRDILRESGDPPAHWRIWVCKFVGKEASKFWYTRSALGSNVPPGTVPTTLDTQNSMFVWGSFCASAMSSTVLKDHAGYDGSLHRIWPVVDPTIDSKTLKKIDDRSAASLADALLQPYANS